MIYMIDDRTNWRGLVDGQPTRKHRAGPKKPRSCGPKGLCVARACGSGVSFSLSRSALSSRAMRHDLLFFPDFYQMRKKIIGSDHMAADPLRWGFSVLCRPSHFAFLRLVVPISDQREKEAGPMSVGRPTRPLAAIKLAAAALRTVNKWSIKCAGGLIRVCCTV